MSLKLEKASPISLRSVGLDERWLQDRIAEDPSLLGLGDLDILGRERAQPSGGRLDFLMRDPEDESRYEVEIMLGTLDETHIIRSIEYWDIERQRYPAYEHRAVIVAEEITSRFFNVIRLLNRSVPMIALQLNAFRLGDSIVLHFTKVLDVYEAAEEAEETAGQADRRYWEKRANPASLAAADAIVSLIPSNKGSPRITYNQGHIAVGTTGRNFCWFHPRKSDHCHVVVKPGGERRAEVIRQLEEAGIAAEPRGRNRVALRILHKEVQANANVIRDVLGACEKLSRQAGEASEAEA